MEKIPKSKEKEKSSKRIQKMLLKKLGPEFISYRPGFSGAKLAYIEGWVAIKIANTIFGYNGWSSEIKSVSLDFCDEISTKIFIGVSVIVRITLKDGTYKEDVGFGSAENQKSKCIAYQKAKKEGVTDAIKRALRQFGEALGNCCYDNEFTKQIAQMKKQKSAGVNEKDLIRKDFEDVSFARSSDIDNLDFDGFD